MCRLCLVAFTNSLLLLTNFTGSVLYQNRRGKQWRSGPSKHARPEALPAVTEMWRRAGELTVSIFTLAKERQRMCLREPGTFVPNRTGSHPTRQHFYARDDSVSHYHEAPTAIPLPTEHTQEQIILKTCIKHKIRKFSKLSSWPEGVQDHSVPCCEPHRQISAHNAQTEEN